MRPARPGRRRFLRATSNSNAWPPVRCSACCSGTADEGARLLKIVGSIDTERHAVHARYRNAHARFQRAQLFELLALLERRCWQLHEARERFAAEGIDTNMVKQRTVAGRGACTGEIERAPARAGYVPCHHR